MDLTASPCYTTNANSVTIPQTDIIRERESSERERERERESSERERERE